MKKVIYITLSLSIYCLSLVGKTFAYWEWTPESGKWINPKYYVGETSLEQWTIAINTYKTEDYESALREFQKLLEYFPTSPEAPEAQFMVGDCQEKLGSPYEACQSYQEAIDKFPSTNRFREIVERQLKIADYFYNEKPSDIPITEKAKGIFSISNWEKAANIYQMAIKNYPYHEKADQIQFRIANCYMNLGKYDIARAEFEKIPLKYPYSQWLEEAEYLKAVCQLNESLKFPNNEEIFGNAIQNFEEFINKYPQSKFVDAAKKDLKKLNDRKSERIYEIARFYEKNKEPEAAKIYYLQVVKQFPDSIWAEYAKSRLNNLE
ncbi:MAG: outer membrane protein assembly factor BamD [Candidatus Ratteibacteria bacterium]|nr:outer membrane protein assembly factor BamD [Candidatus Ratteibacteria bacterium]